LNLCTCALASCGDEINVKRGIGEEKSKELVDAHGHDHVNHFAAFVQDGTLDGLVIHVTFIFRLGRFAVRRGNIGIARSTTSAS
jgi:hypothetical protein